jgi:ATP-dependent helicase/DNAse subunit B
MENQLPEHRSYSQLTTFQQCQHKYYLGRILQVPEQPAVFTAAGTAVHSAIEKINHYFYEKQKEQNAEK